MHRFVALIATSSDRSCYDQARQRLGARLRGWRTPVAGSLASVWVSSRSPSQLGSRPLGRAGCLIGRDFEPTAHTEVLTRTWGAYLALEIEDDGVHVTRDPTGRIPCWRLSLTGADVLFSDYADVYWICDPQPAIDWAYIGHHLNHDYLVGERTGLEGVTELLPGERLSYRLSPAARQIVWWPHRVAEAPHEHINDAMAALRRGAEASVGAWANLYDGIILDLSGGLDSAIVLGLLVEHAGRRDVIALNRLSPGPDGDERRYARDAADRHGVRLVEQEAEALAPDAWPAFSRKLLRPRARLLPLGYDELGAKTAVSLNADAFFTGTGGDHLFYDHLPASAICDFLRASPDLRGYFDTATHLAQLSRDTVWGVSKVAFAYAVAKRNPTREQLESRNPFLTAEGRAMLDHPRFAHPCALAALEHAPPARARQILQMLELQRHYYRYGRADVAEETHPLFSQPVMEASLRTPPYWFGAGGMQRGLARKAFADLLPESIRLRESKGGNTAFWTAFMTRRLPFIRELLLEGRLVQRGLVDRAALDAALKPLVLAAGKGIPAMNLCLPVELWIRQTEADRAAARQETAA